MKESNIEITEPEQSLKDGSYVGSYIIKPQAFLASNRHLFVSTLMEKLTNKLIEILTDDREFMDNLLGDLKTKLSRQLTDEVAITMFKRIINEKEIK